MQSQQFYVHYVLVKKCSLKPFLNFDNELAHIRESGNEFHLSIYRFSKSDLKMQTSHAGTTRLYSFKSM